jgi:hypothetical protein
MVSRNVSITFIVADRCVGLYLYMGTILKDLYLKLLCCFVLLRNTVIPGTI